MPRSTTITRTGTIFIPQNYLKPAYKVQITRNDGTVDTVADSSSATNSDLIHLSVKPGLNEVAGTFTLSLSNKDGKYTGRWTGNERIDIWADFSNASTKLFRGKCESIMPIFNERGRSIELAGRDGMGELQDKTIVQLFLDTEAAEIFKAVINDANTSVTYAVSSTSTVIENFQSRDLTAAQCIKEVAKRVPHDFYVDTSFALQHFSKGSRTNFNEALIHGLNLKSLNMGTDTRGVKNFVRVYGANVDNSTNVLIIKTAEDSTSQASYGKRVLIVQDATLVSHDAAQERANAELAEKKDNPQQGSVTGMGLPTLLPGQNFRVSDPYSGVDGFYRAIDITHDLNIDQGFMSHIIIEKYPELIESSIVELRQVSRDSSVMNIVIAAVDSFVITFSESISVVTLSNTLIVDGRLKIATGSQGTAISNIFKARTNVNKAQIRVAGRDLLVSKFYVTNDKGLNLIRAIPDVETVNFPNADDDVQIKIELVSDSNNVDPQLECIGVILQ